ncbi:uncharacterized protein TRUGW13939_02183 [Talaromyces rugulosus]|uniref:Uncharacterized protein n=1 Tax=Talaromyces rugulosus TaxID=121627 RepID=A0A7H8QNK9_TALRU|nr:uncharacterized protein TRUGW13939_02183 [Talaromyces rugulosus]QKX55091.1 hypothetical protein TRUGW13939_02183 [Talaromyces rugulosus]
MTTVSLYVAIYNDEGVYKHWAFFIDGPTDTQKNVLNIMSSSTQYRFERRHGNEHESEILSKIVYICEMEESKIKTTVKIAKTAVIHNEYPGYNCQDYVLEMLDTLEENGVIDGSDENYKKKKEIVKSKQEGLI